MDRQIHRHARSAGRQTECQFYTHSTSSTAAVASLHVPDLTVLYRRCCFYNVELTRSFATAKSTARPSIFVGVLKRIQIPAAKVQSVLQCKLHWMATMLCWPGGHARTVTYRLQRVLNAAARIVSGIRKFDRGLTHLLYTPSYTSLTFLNVSSTLGVTVHRCLQGKTPQYLIECCTPTSEVASRQRLRSAIRHQLAVPRYRRSKFDRRAFSVAGPGLELTA